MNYQTHRSTIEDMGKMIETQAAELATLRTERDILSAENERMVREIGELRTALSALTAKIERNPDAA